MGYQRATLTKTPEASNERQGKTASQRSQSNPKPLHPLLQLQPRLGNRRVNHLIQTKLKVGKPGDIYEQEADRVADTVMRMSAPQLYPGVSVAGTVQTKPLMGQITPLVQRQEEEEETAQTLQRQEEEEETAQTLQRQEEEEEAQAKEAPHQTPTVTPNLEARIQSVRGGGKSLSSSALNFFEPRFGADFSDVRVHTDSQAASMSKELNAQAFTIGNDIFFDAGRYEPHTITGKHLLAHELTHTVQQQPGRKIASSAQVQKHNSSGLVQRREMGAVTNRVGVGQKSAAATPPAKETAPATPAETPSPVSKISQTAPNTEKAESAPASPPTQEPAETTTETATPEMEAVLVEEPTAKAGKEAPTKTAEAKEAKKAAGEGKETEETTEEPPASPATDPSFQAMVKKAKRVTKQQRSHAPASAKSQEAQAASQPEPSSEVESQAQANQVEAMEQAQTPAFDAASFKAELKQRIAELAPKNLGQADEFKSGKQLESFKGEVKDKAKQAQAPSQAPLKEKTEQPPDPSGLEPKVVTELPPAEPGKKPPSLKANKAIPKSKPTTQVEAPLKQNSQQLDQQMAEADISEEQLANANEPQFATALEAKKTAQTVAVEAPQTYRQSEIEQLSQAEAAAAATEKKQLQGMYGQRSQLFQQVESEQVKAKSKDEQARTQVISEINRIYGQTKTEVENILNPLEGQVTSRFETGAEAAKQAFEDYVAPHMEVYKERYDGILGAGRWVKDKLLGVPREVTAFFGEGRRLYLEKMDAVLDDISNYIAEQLTAAKEKITEGKQKIKDFVENLEPSLKTVGEEAVRDIQGQFEELEAQVNNAGTTLVDKLAKQYTDKVQQLDGQIEEMKKSNQPWFAKAFDALASVIETINNLRKMLQKVLGRIAEVVGKIIKNPIGFLGNLIKGLSQGFKNFVSNIFTHLQTGLIAWLTGTLGPTGIQIPENLFSLAGIFNLVMQVLGLTWDYIRSKAVKMFGETVVAAMEKGAEIFQVLRTGGVMGLWEYIKEQFTDLKEMVIEQIKSMVTNEVIKAGVKWILGLLSPVGAFIKAATAIYDIIMFFVERATQIGEFVNSVLDAVGAIASGAIGGAAKLVENALAKSLPVLIGLLASLAGVTGVAKKVQGIIKRIRGRIDKAIDKLLLKAKKAFKTAVKKGKKGLKKLAQWWKKRLSLKTRDGKNRQLFFKKRGKSFRLFITGSEFDLDDWISEQLRNPELEREDKLDLWSIKSDLLQQLEDEAKILSQDPDHPLTKIKRVQEDIAKILREVKIKTSKDPLIKKASKDPRIYIKDSSI